jgi:hypothetical protein
MTMPPLRPPHNPLVTEGIGPYYVYLLIDPRNDQIFYVGKGTGLRFASHLEEQIVGGEQPSPDELGAKQAIIDAIRGRGDEPVVEFARRQIANEHEAYLVEAALIDVLRRHGSPELANLVRGHGTGMGLATLQELREELATPVLETDQKALLIKLGDWRSQPDAELPRPGHGYRHGMSDAALYDSTRAWWRISPEVALGYPYAVCVYGGVTRAAWEIDHRSWRISSGTLYAGRIAFEGRRVRPGENAYEEFIDRQGRRVPATRPDGRAVFGSGQPIAYWP